MTLPNFFLIGAPKAATTTLYAYLDRHPHVYMPYVKEPGFFFNEKEYAHGLHHYSRTFFSGVRGHHAAIGEATPWYLYFRTAIARIASTIPSCGHRFIVLLRNPISRAYSMYREQVRTHRESRPFERLVRNLAAEEWPTEHRWQREYTSFYFPTSRYDRFLPAYFDRFGSANVLVLLQDDLREEAPRRALLDRVAVFLDVDPTLFPREGILDNVANGPRSVLISAVLRRLRESNRPLVRRLKGVVPRRWMRPAVHYIAMLNSRAAPAGPRLPAESFPALLRYFEETIRYSEAVTGRDLTAWREGPAQ